MRFALAALAAVLNVVMQTAGFLASPEATRPELSYVIAHTLVALVFAVCACVAWSVADTPLPGWLMFAVAALWIPQTIYAAIGDWGLVWPAVRSIDLLWAIAAGTLVLVYHSGRLTGALDRALVVTGVVAGVFRALATLVLVTPDAVGCACAPNPLALTSDGTLSFAVDVAYRVIGVGVVAVISARVLVRYIRASTPARAVAFIMPLALLLWALSLIYDATRFALNAPFIPVVEYLSLGAMATIPLSFLGGLFYVRSLRGRVSDLMVLTRDGADTALWESSLARTLRDPSLKVYWWDAASARYLDSAGEPAQPEHPESMLAISAPEGPIALISHDHVLTENTKLLDAVSTALRLSVDNGRLRRELERTLVEVRQSRLRIVEATDQARRRIERDLHDGSQQQLVALAISLRLATEKAVDAGAPEVADELRRASELLSTALRELRELARGIHPLVLTEGGLELALPELAARAPVRTSVAVHLPARLPALTEATIYFVVAECLTNAAKYAEANRARVSLEARTSHVVVTVSDDGRGGATVGSGSGLLGLIDRVEALGGELRVVSPAGAGTTVIARLPFTHPATTGAVPVPGEATATGAVPTVGASSTGAASVASAPVSSVPVSSVPVSSVPVSAVIEPDAARSAAREPRDEPSEHRRADESQHAHHSRSGR